MFLYYNNVQQIKSYGKQSFQRTEKHCNLNAL